MSEQRQEARIEDPTVNIDGSWSTVYNLSLGGMCIVSLGALQIGSQRSYTLVDRGSGSTCTLVGEVKWTSSISQESTRAGIQWIDLSDRMRHWLKARIIASAQGPTGELRPFRQNEGRPIAWF